MKRKLIFFSLMISFIAGKSQPVKTGLFDPASVKVSEISTNTIRSDFGPAVIGDSLYFSSYRDAVIEKSDKELKTKEFYDLFKAGIDMYGNVISERQPVDEFVSRFHDGPVSWCAKTGELFVTQSNYVDPSVKYKPFRSEDIKLRIVIAMKVKDRWTVVEDFPYNNSEYSVGHPAINVTGDSLYFTSDMPGGFGLTDIYLSVRKNGKWGNPVNLGSQINTSGKDEFPFITGNSYPGRYLIFASTEHNSIGGFDLFYKDLNDSKSEAVAFPQPINSISDDFAMNLPDKVEHGYFTSNRPGTGNDDIYKLTFNKYIQFLEQLLVLDSKTTKPISKASVNYCDKKSFETDSVGKTSFWFERNAVCKTTVSALGYKDNYLTIKIGAPMPGVVLKDTILLDMFVNEKIVLKNIYYDFDKWDILPESAKELDRLVALMKANPEMKVELSSHTDARGTQRYNLKLSQLRAQAAVDYIVSKGIDKSKIKGMGFGESQLINKCKDGQLCTSAQQRENRRTELYIPGVLKGEPVIQEIGDYSDGKPDHKPGYSSTKTHGSIYGKADKVSVIGLNDKGFYLILGSFKDKENASKYVEQLKGIGSDATVLSDSDPFRVGNRYDTYTQAKKALDDIKAKNKIGWISNGI